MLMTKGTIHKILSYLIVIVWLVNGLVCKLMNIVPRHTLIVSYILGREHAVFFTKCIGFFEVLMAIWILLGYKSRLNAIMQILIIAAMNALEFILVPDLLLFGKMNAVFATGLIFIVYYNEFILKKKTELIKRVVVT
jgi:DoxX-like family